jgi:hypothetical protein
LLDKIYQGDLSGARKEWSTLLDFLESCDDFLEGQPPIDHPSGIAPLFFKNASALTADAVFQLAGEVAKFADLSLNQSIATPSPRQCVEFTNNPQQQLPIHGNTSIGKAPHPFALFTAQLAVQL